MLIIGMMVGLLAGATLGQNTWFFGALIGAVSGWLIDKVQRLSAQVGALQQHVEALRPPAEPPALAPRPAAAPAAQAPAAAQPAAFEATRPLPPAAPHPPGAWTQPAGGLAAPPVPARSSPMVGATPAAPAPNVLAQWFLRGNTVARAGLIVLFFGVAFLLKFAYEHSHIPVEVRLMGVCLGAIALLIGGWRLRERRAGYALTLQGGGVGLLYLTIYAALRLYAVVPAVPAFVLLVLVAGSAALLAVFQDSLALAVAGAVGGFLAPILASTGQGSHTTLFSYYVVLNLGIFAVAWRKSWRVLNLVGFAFTFVIGLWWGASDYRAEFFGTTEPFLVIFFLIYFLIPVLVARQAPGPGATAALAAPRALAYVDGALVFGVPIAAFGLQAALVRDFEYGAAWSALVLGAFYLAAATGLWRRGGAGRRLLAEAYLALGAGFATLAIPLAFDGRTTSAVWAVEGAGAVWLGLRQARWLARLAGYALQLAAGVAFVLSMDRTVGSLPVLNSRYLGCVLITMGAWFCSASVTRSAETRRSYERVVPALMMLWGALWWVGGGLREIDRHLDRTLEVHAALFFLTATAVALGECARRLDWPVARWGAYGLVPVLALGLLLDVAGFTHPLGNLGYAAWPLALAAHLWILWRCEDAQGSTHASLQQSRAPRSGSGPQDRALLALWHPAGLWIGTALLSWELRWQIRDLLGAASVWGLVALGLVPAATLWLLATAAVRRHWPVAANPRSYLVVAALPMAAYLLFWTVWANLSSDGNTAPLAYVALFNPLDISLGLVFLALANWFLRLRASAQRAALGQNLAAVYFLAGAAVFLWANGVVLRSLHQWASVPFNSSAMWRSVLVQAALSLLWSLTALLLMTLATRRAIRELWLVGAALMGVVVAKLFAVDLSNVGGVERIVSFIGVGALMLVIGYVAPVPPRLPAAPGGARK